MDQKNVIKKSALSPTVLIAGGAGFIGSSLAETLLLKDSRVIVLDNFSTGKDVFVHSLLKNPKFVLFDADINQGIPPQIQSVDYVFHLAGLETYLFDKEDVNLDSLLTNALGTKNVLDFVQKSSAKFLLASSIDVYKGLISPISLDQYFGATSQEEKKYSLTEAKRYAEALVWEYYKKHQIDVRIARLPEVYGPRMNLDSTGSLGSLLRNLMEHKDLTVYGEGVEKEFYLYISDAVSGLVKALFTETSVGKIYTLAPKEPHTVLETTYLVKNLANSEVRVVFKPKTERISTEDPRIPDKSTLKDLNWEEKQEFKEGIIKTLKWFGYDTNEHTFKPGKLIEKKAEEKKAALGVSSITDSVTATVVPIPKVNIKKTVKKQASMPFIALGYLSLFLTIVMVFIGIPVTQTYYYAKKGTNNLQQAQRNLTQLNPMDAQKASNDAFKNFHKAQESFSRIKWLFTITKQEVYFNDVQRLFSSANYTSKSVYFLSKGSDPFLNFWESIKPTSTQLVSKNDFSVSHQNFVTAKENLQLAQAELKQVNTSFVSVRFNNYLDPLDEFAKQLDLLTVFSAELPDLIGLNGKKTYLILFQNSNELRATGGFIGSYANLELTEGKISSLVIDDIYNPDGQIRLREIRIAPPAPIAAYLNEDTYFIRNANWNADFSKTADDITDLFFRIDGRSYDGVFAVDLNFVENILKVTGPVYLTAYNEEITTQNLYERAQFHSEFNYEDGSDQKRTFLTVLGGKLLEKIFSLQGDKVYTLTAQLQKSMKEKHLLVNIPHGGISMLLQDNGWDGKLKNTNGDFLYVVNSNLGGTKANYYVKNELEYNVLSLTRDGLLRAELNLAYTHTGQSNAWPGGSYTNYVRVFTKSGSKLTGAKLAFDDDTYENVFDNAVVSQEGAFTVFEYGFTLQPKQKANLVFEYDLSPALAIDKNMDKYNLFWQKQPGTHNDLVKFKFSPPFGVQISNAVPAMLLGTGTAEYKGVLNTDLDLSLFIR